MGRVGCGRRHWEGAGRRRGDAQVSAPPFSPAVERLGHLSIEEGPIGALITQAPVARSGAHGEERRDSLPPPPSPLSVAAPIEKTHNMNDNKHNALRGRDNSERISVMASDTTT